jgi:hypothetical protein
VFAPPSTATGWPDRVPPEPAAGAPARESSAAS